jgi:hypothetical protein
MQYLLEPKGYLLNETTVKRVYIGARLVRSLGKKNPLTKLQIDTLRIVLAAIYSFNLDKTSPTINGQKIGRYIRRYWPILPDHINQWVANYIISTQYISGGKVIIHRTKTEIMDAMRNSQSYCSSCMTGSDYIYFDTIAADERVHLVTYNVDGEIRARRLVWHLENTQWLDRRYPNGDSALCSAFDLELASLYPDARWRNGNSLPSGKVTFRRKDGVNVTPEPITLERHEFLAYLDSFHYCAELGDSYITLSCRASDETEGRADSTSGAWPDGSGGCQCYECNERLDPEDAYSVNDETYCCDCCSSCEYCYEYAPNNEITWSRLLEVSYCDSCQSNHVDALLEND